MRAKDFIVEKVITEKNVPTNPSKWNYYKNQAKKKFDVYPSAYANGWAAKKYKAAGGKWKTESVVRESVMDILKKHPQATAKMKADGDVDTGSDLYQDLYAYYQQDMDYGTQKARDGDPAEFIMNALDDLGIFESVITELSVSGESTNKLLMYYTKFKNAVTANEKRVLDAISKELEKRKVNYKQPLAADQYTTEAEQSPYAIGMAKAMKMYKDKPPLAKKTIKKAHEIAKAVMKDDVQLNELGEKTFDYVKLNDGSVLELEYKMGVNAQPMGNSLKIRTANPKTIPTGSHVGPQIEKLDNAGVWKQHAIKKAMQQGKI